MAGQASQVTFISKVKTRLGLWLARTRLYGFGMSSSFHNADRRTYRKVMLVGLLACAAFVAFSFFAREQPANTYVLQKADRLVRNAGTASRGLH